MSITKTFKRIKELFSSFRHQVFWPPFILLLAALSYSLIDVESFLGVTTQINDFFLDKFGWLFSVGTSLMLVSCIVIFFHPIAKKRIGGNNAQPMLSKWRWFSIVICTTIATGVIFWGTAEPIYHLNAPPSFSGVEAGSAAAAEYSLSVMFLHWTFTPYAIYTIPAIMFALAFYNEKRSFSLKSTLYPFIASGKAKWLGIGIDGICLYALVAGMSASLGAGILTLSGGIKSLFGIESNFILLIITVCLVGAFILSAISGLMKGIRLLSDLNIRVFLLLALFVFIFGPTWSIIRQAFNALGHYFTHLTEFSLVSVLYPNDPWPKSWTSFNWANWLAWAPITALFLGRLSYGYTVRQFMIVNWILPSLFGMIWMSIFSGTVIDMQLNQGINLNGLLSTLGPESIVYKMFETLPMKGMIAVVFLFTAFLSYVTAADSNTEAMGGISSTGISPDTPSPPKFIKVLWGITIGAVAFIMISLAGVDGVKMLSNLGGLPALFLIIAINTGLIKVLFFTKKN